MDLRIFAAYLVTFLGEIRGKKAFQKLVYLAKLEGVPFGYSYRMHYYGPYSDAVAEELEQIYLEDIIDCSPNSYIYHSGSKTKKVLNDAKDIIEQYSSQLNNLLSHFGQMSPLDLEIYATAHFVWRHQKVFERPCDRSTVIEEIKKAKYPKFTIEKIERAYDDMIEWGLIASDS